MNYLKTSHIILFSIIVVCFIATIGCVESPEYSEGGSSTAVQSETIEILEHGFEYGEYGNLYVVGKAKNTGSKSLSYAEVRAKFYDDSGALLGTSFDNINDLGPGETWNFKIIYLDMNPEEVASYKIAAGTSF